MLCSSFEAFRCKAKERGVHKLRKGFYFLSRCNMISNIYEILYTSLWPKLLYMT